MLEPERYVLSRMQQAMSIPTCQTFVLLLRNVFGPFLTSQTTPSLILASSYTNVESASQASFVIIRCIHTGGANSIQHASLRTTSPRVLTPGSPRLRELPKSASFGVGYMSPISGVPKNTDSVRYTITKLAEFTLTIAYMHISAPCQ